MKTNKKKETRKTKRKLYKSRRNKTIRNKTHKKYGGAAASSRREEAKHGRAEANDGRADTHMFRPGKISYRNALNNPHLSNFVTLQYETDINQFDYTPYPHELIEDILDRRRLIMHQIIRHGFRSYFTIDFRGTVRHLLEQYRLDWYNIGEVAKHSVGLDSDIGSIAFPSVRERIYALEKLMLLAQKSSLTDAHTFPSRYVDPSPFDRYKSAEDVLLYASIDKKTLSDEQLAFIENGVIGPDIERDAVRLRDPLRPIMTVDGETEEERKIRMKKNAMELARLVLFHRDTGQASVMRQHRGKKRRKDGNKDRSEEFGVHLFNPTSFYKLCGLHIEERKIDPTLLFVDQELYDDVMDRLRKTCSPLLPPIDLETIALQEASDAGNKDFGHLDETFIDVLFPSEFKVKILQNFSFRKRARARRLAHEKKIRLMSISMKKKYEERKMGKMKATRKKYPERKPTPAAGAGAEVAEVAGSEEEGMEAKAEVAGSEEEGMEAQAEAEEAEEGELEESP